MGISRPGYIAYLQSTLRVTGRIGCGLYGLSVLASFSLAVLEYAIAIFLMIFLFTLGFVDSAALPGWLPFEVRELRPSTIWIALFVIMGLRGGLQIVSYQSRILLTQRTHARLRMVLGYLIFVKSGSNQIPLSTINLYFSELFPKAVSFIFHFTQITSFLVQAVLISAGMFYFARSEALVGLAGLAVMGLFVLRLNRYTHRIAKRVPRVSADLERTKVRAVRNWLLIKILRTEREEYKRYAEAVLQYYRHSSIAYLIANSGTSLIPIFGVIVIAAIVFANVHFFKTPGVDLVAFLYLFFRFQQMMGQGSTMLGDLFSWRVQFRESIRLAARLPAAELHAAFRPAKGLNLLSGRLDLGHIQTLAKHADTGGPPPEPPAIKIERIAFTWPEDDKPVLLDFSLDVPGGAQIGITGPNGSGKSTLLAVIAGVLHPDAGRVIIDNLPGGDYLQKYNAHVAYVGPEPFLIQGSIRDNLGYACGKAFSDDQLMAALEQVRLEKFVASLPAGLGHAIDESGAGLSTGQKQRLTIARAFLRKPKLLIMDEPTANIDQAAETLLTAALQKLKGSCTVVIVSHKAEILRDADQIVAMRPVDGGAVAKTKSAVKTL